MAITAKLTLEPGIHVQILLQVFTKGSKINNWMYFYSKSVTISAIFKNVIILVLQSLYQY